MFDLIMKKKKKKKKVFFDFDVFEEFSIFLNMDENIYEMENQENIVEEKEEKEDKGKIDDM